MWLWEMKKSVLPHREARQATFADIEQTDPLPIIDWKWDNHRFLVLIHELGWMVCDLPQTEDTEETVREMLSNRWIASQYAEMAYFHVNLVTKGSLD